MDREIIQRHLAQAEDHIILGERHIVRQRELVAELEQKGHDTTEAKRLLAEFEELQVMHLADCDRLRRELDAAQ
jgi:arginine repressor